MAFKNKLQYDAILSGGAGNPNAFKIITSTSCSLGGRIASAFMNLTVDEDGEQVEGELTEAEEQISEGDNSTAQVVQAKGENWLANTWPYGIAFEGRFTKLVPAEGHRFKVWLL